MKKVFPLNIKMGQILGIISILKTYNGEISMQKLSDESFLHIDDLINILEACKLLKLIDIKEDDVKLKRILINKGQHEIILHLSKTLRNLEPFSYIIKKIKKCKEVSTTELFQELLKKGLVGYRDNISGLESFKKDLLMIGLRLKIFSYNQDKDIWTLYKEKI